MKTIPTKNLDQISIIHLDDSEMDLLYVKYYINDLQRNRLINTNIQLTQFLSAHQALYALKNIQDQADIIIVDYYMPAMTGDLFLQKVVNLGIYSQFIILTDSLDINSIQHHIEQMCAFDVTILSKGKDQTWQKISKIINQCQEKKLHDRNLNSNFKDKNRNHSNKQI